MAPKARHPTVVGLTCETELEQMPLSPTRLAPVVVQTPGSLNSQHSLETPLGLQRSPIFRDAESIKEYVRDSLHRPSYSVVNLYHESGLCQSIARSNSFEYLTLGMILLNSIWIAVDTDHNPSDVIFYAPRLFQVIECIFFGFFLLEWFVRFMAFRRKRDTLKDSAFLFDSVLVLAMVLDTVVMGIITVSTGTRSKFDPSILRLARLLRVARVSRLARLLRNLPELMILIKGTLAATRSVLLTLSLVVIVLYIFAIAFTQLTAGSQIHTRYFSTVPHSMYSLLVYGTFLDNIGNMMSDVGQDNFFAAAALVVYILLASITLMNMLIGVLCVVVTSIAVQEKEEMSVNFVKGKLKTILQDIAEESVSKTDFANILKNEDAIRALHEVGVDPEGLIDFADIIFQDMGAPGANDKRLSFGEFVQVLMDLRGSNMASVKDVMNIKKSIRTGLEASSRQLERRIAKVDERLRLLINFNGTVQKPLQKNSHFHSASAGAFFDSAKSADSDGICSLSSQLRSRRLRQESFSQESLVEGTSCIGRVASQRCPPPITERTNAELPAQLGNFEKSNAPGSIEEQVPERAAWIHHLNSKENYILHAKIDHHLSACLSDISAAFQSLQICAQGIDSQDDDKPTVASEHIHCRSGNGTAATLPGEMRTSLMRSSRNNLSKEAASSVKQADNTPKEFPAVDVGFSI